MWDNVCFLNMPFPSSLVSLFQSESKCETILMKMTLICMKMKLLTEFIFTWKVSHLDSFWNRGTFELGNGLFNSPEQCTQECGARWAYGRIEWSGYRSQGDGLLSGYKSRVERIAHPRLETEPSPGGGSLFSVSGQDNSHILVTSLSTQVYNWVLTNEINAVCNPSMACFHCQAMKKIYRKPSGRKRKESVTL